MYFLTPNEHFITIRDRNGAYPVRRRYWNDSILQKVLDQQKSSEDVFVTKYSTDKLVQYIVLDFDSKEDRNIAFKESSRLRNFFENNGHPCVLVDSTNKGYHLYAQINPVLFRDEGNWTMPNWDLFFEGFVRYFIMNSSRREYTSIDETNTNAGLNGNIRLIGSVHPSTGERVEILRGDFSDDVLEPTELQNNALKFAYKFCESCEEARQHRVIRKTKVVNGVDPIEANDLRVIFPQIFGGDIKHYTNYSMMCCPFHGDTKPSLMIWKSCYKCLSCGEKGNIWTLKKKGLVEFDLYGEVVH